MEVQKLSIEEIARIASESRSVIYDAITAGHLKTFLVGRRRFARPEAVRDWINFLEAESDAGRPVCYRARPAVAVEGPPRERQLPASPGRRNLKRLRAE